ncbi:MAG: PocR ligand-binding domain-containing protein [Desulfosarcina sp.]|nr:PocR ligand-binding domain-containing protein [Desulfosarcina sp.]
MELTDILSREKWEQFEEEVFNRFHINCTVYDDSGQGVTGKPHWCNRLCPQIKANKESLAAICATGNQHFMAQAKQSHKAVIDECDAGLIKITVPIFVDGEFLGTAGGCGLLPAGGEVQTFLLEKTTGLSETEILGLCEGLGTMTQKEAETMAAYIEKRTTQMVNDYLRRDR